MSNKKIEGLQNQIVRNHAKEEDNIYGPSLSAFQNRNNVQSVFLEHITVKNEKQ